MVELILIAVVSQAPVAPPASVTRQSLPPKTILDWRNLQVWAERSSSPVLLLITAGPATQAATECRTRLDAAGLSWVALAAVEQRRNQAAWITAHRPQPPSLTCFVWYSGRLALLKSRPTIRATATPEQLREWWRGKVDQSIVAPLGYCPQRPVIRAR